MQPVQDAVARVEREPQHRLDRRHVRHHQHGFAAVLGDDPVAGAPHPVRHVVEALAVGRLTLVSRSQRPVQFRVTLGGLAERQALPRTEVGLDQVVVDGDVEAQRLGRRRRGVVGALQRRA